MLERNENFFNQCECTISIFRALFSTLTRRQLDLHILFRHTTRIPSKLVHFSFLSSLWILDSGFQVLVQMVYNHFRKMRCQTLQFISTSVCRKYKFIKQIQYRVRLQLVPIHFEYRQSMLILGRNAQFVLSAWYEYTKVHRIEFLTDICTKIKRTAEVVEVNGRVNWELKQMQKSTQN